MKIEDPVYKSIIKYVSCSELTEVEHVKCTTLSVI